MDYTKFLQRITDEKDKKYMMDLVEDVLIGLEKEIDSRFHSLEERFYRETFVGEQESRICEGIYRAGEQRLPDGFYDELIEDQMVGSDILEKGDVVRNIFLTCSGQELIHLWENPWKIYGTIICEEKEYEVSLRIQRDTRYEESIRKVWKAIKSSGGRMQTPYLPYSNRMAVVCIEELPENVVLRRDHCEIYINYDIYKNVVDEISRPCWNIEWRKGKTYGFPLPCEDEIHYEHKIKIPKEEEKDTFYPVWEKAEGAFVRRAKDYLCVNISDDDSRVFHLLHIIELNKDLSYLKDYHVVSSVVGNSFTEQTAKQHNNIPVTKAELIRLVTMLDESHKFSLEQLKFSEESIRSDTYDMNAFRAEEDQWKRRRENMVMTFFYQGKKDHMVIDRLSYIVSCIQQYINDYTCIGRLR